MFGVMTSVIVSATDSVQTPMDIKRTLGGMSLCGRVVSMSRLLESKMSHHWTSRGEFFRVVYVDTASGLQAHLKFA